MKILRIALGTLLILAVFYHGGLWLFKTRVVKNRIEKSLVDDKERLSIASVEASILPFSQKITIKNMVVKESKVETTFEEIIIHPSAFSNTFLLQFPKKIYLKFNTGSTSSLEFSSDSKFAISSDIKLENFLVKYNGSGFKLTDENGKTLSEIQLEDAQVEIGFGKVFFYRSKSSFSKITENNNVLASKGPTNVDITMTSANDMEHRTKININIQDLQFFALKNENLQQDPNKILPFQYLSYSNSDSGKIGIVLVGELGARYNDKNKTSPQKTGKTLSQIALKIENFELSDQKYKVFLNGNIQYLPEKSPLPYGIVNLQIENLDNIINSLLQSGKERKGDANPALDLAMNNIEEIKAIIKNIAARNPKTTSSRLVFEINNNSGGFDVKINGASFEELMSEYATMKAKKQLNADPLNGANPAVNSFGSHNSYPARNSQY